MREILFRGKRMDNGEWVEGFYNHIPCGRFGTDEHMIQTVLENGKIGMLYDIDQSTVCQYTGLKDKNGKRIFEGDILRRAYHPNEDMIVEWYDGRFVFHRRIYPKDYGCESLVCCQQNVDRLAIIGNIHDNPEMLKGGEG